MLVEFSRFPVTNAPPRAPLGVEVSLEHLGSISLTLLWRVKKQVMYLYEIDADAVAQHVPSRLDLVEVRPGVALLAIEALHYHTDHFRPGYREFFEAVLTCAVQPDLSVKMPVPRFCMHAISVISDSPEFCEQEGRLLYTPTELVPDLRMTFSEDGGSCDMFDGTELIVSCRNTSPTVRYQRRTLFGQYYTNTNGLQHGLWRWDGEVYEHQTTGDFGHFGPHKFWKNIDLKRIRGCYRQMMAKPDLQTDVRFYHVGRI